MLSCNFPGIQMKVLLFTSENWVYHVLLQLKTEFADVSTWLKDNISNINSCIEFSFCFFEIDLSSYVCNEYSIHHVFDLHFMLNNFAIMSCAVNTVSFLSILSKCKCTLRIKIRVIPRWHPEGLLQKTWTTEKNNNISAHGVAQGHCRLLQVWMWHMILLSKRYKWKNICHQYITEI